MVPTGSLSHVLRRVLNGGLVVLVLHGRLSTDPTSEDNYTPWELFAEAISHLVSKGLIDEERLDSFDVPYYTPSQEEVKEMIDKHGRTHERAAPGYSQAAF
ncbi:hypothetical protein Ddye_032073 [Dipteronia dyeriana]|uniref:Uncharacterized protein n=1 Tax=Dipteronia dyeriana TaxID=168575 RepID=A0AAD9TK72_9ROSI|nr:hypothetical protein Ddye_032073 [Dipteronia dyeriana]